MGVMCSLLGHDYGDPDVERERSEEGTEVVLTAKRVERCRNCGHERTISENTEVTALSAAAGVVREPDGTVVVSPDGAGTTGGRPNRSSTDRNGSEDREGPKVSESIVSRKNARADRSHENPATGSDETRTAADGSVEALDDESSDTGGSIVDSVTAGSALEKPATGIARAGTDDAVPPDESGESTIDRVHDRPPLRDRPHRAPGEWPAESVPTNGPRAGTDSADAGTGTGRWPDATDAGANPVRDGGTSETVRDGRADTTRSESRTATGSFACSSCGFDTAVADSPLRAGDICPDCGVGYLALETRKS